MELQEAARFIQNKNILSETPQQWADLGCGGGLFTHALASLLQPGSTIYAVDKNISAFKKMPDARNVSIKPMKFDFITEALNMHDLDGVLMANSLHYVKDKITFIDKLASVIKTDGYLLIIEYDTNVSNPWVPYPVSFLSLQQLFTQAGYSAVTKLHEHPSAYGRANIYSAIISKHV